MKILLFGEYSGFFNCLKEGLVALGHDVFLASNGDGIKNYPSDFRWDSHFSRERLGRLAPFYNVANLFCHLNILSGYDVVLLIGPNNISKKRWINRPIYDYLLENNKLVYLSGAGASATMFDYWYNTESKYKSYMEGYLLFNPKIHLKNNQTLRNWENELMNRVTGYLPIWYEYYKPFESYKTCRNVIRIPVNVTQFDYKPNIVKDKIVFYHGERILKGARFIKPAFEKMRKHFSDKAEFICQGVMPFNDYMQLVERTNVIVDDANSYSVAMNGFFSMLKGKLIMGGAEPVANKMYGYENNPIFNICPDVDQICETMIEIIKRREEIEEIGLKGRQFVEKYHNYIDVAQQYIDIFEKDLKK